MQPQCMNCGRQYPTGCNFCGDCGQSLHNTRETHCTTCGETLIDDNTNYCPRCGEPTIYNIVNVTPSRTVNVPDKDSFKAKSSGALRVALRVSEIGKIVASSKIAVDWTFLLGQSDQFHVLRLSYSRMSGKVKISFDNENYVQERIPSACSTHWICILDLFPSRHKLQLFVSQSEFPSFSAAKLEIDRVPFICLLQHCRFKDDISSEDAHSQKKVYPPQPKDQEKMDPMAWEECGEFDPQVEQTKMDVGRSPTLVEEERLLRRTVEELKTKGNIAFREENYGEAIRLYTDALRECGQKNEVKDLTSILYSNRSAAHLALGSCPEALNDADKGIESNPLYSKAHLRRANALYYLSQTSLEELQMSKDSYSKAMEILALSPKTTECIGMEKEIKSKLDAVQKAIQINEIRQQGNELYRLMNIAGAVGLYGEALKISNEFPKATILVLYCRATCYHMLGEHQSGLRDVERALQLDSFHVDGLLLKVLLLRAIGGKECLNEAVSNLELILQLCSKEKANNVRRKLEEVREELETTTKTNLYAVLGLTSRVVTDKEIRTAYRKMCLSTHPDKVSDPEKKKTTEEDFKIIQHAYSVLSNSESRKVYDSTNP